MVAGVLVPGLQLHLLSTTQELSKGELLNAKWY